MCGCEFGKLTLAIANKENRKWAMRLLFSVDLLGSRPRFAKPQVRRRLTLGAKNPRHRLAEVYTAKSCGCCSFGTNQAAPLHLVACRMLGVVSYSGEPSTTDTSSFTRKHSSVLRSMWPLLIKMSGMRSTF